MDMTSLLNKLFVHVRSMLVLPQSQLAIDDIIESFLSKAPAMCVEATNPSSTDFKH